jgi:RND family efflux transporter MFP subunit
MKTKILVSICTASALIAMAACSDLGGQNRKSAPPLPVSAYEVTTGSAAYYEEYPATVTALNQVEVRAEVSGYISKIFFTDGQRVKKGMKLYSIDERQYKAAFDQASANLNVAKANLAKALQDAQRYEDLAKKDAVARQTLEHAQADLQAAKMQVAAVEANVTNVQTNLHYSVLYAPFDGIIGISLVKLGSSVQAGQTLLNTISSENPVVVDCAVDEKLISRFTGLLGQKPDPRDSTFTIVLPDGSAYPHTGHLSMMDRAVDPQTGTIRVRVTFPNNENLLRTGLTCNLRLKQSGSGANILIPYRAVVEQMGEYFVYTIQGNRVTQRRIYPGRTIRDMVVVKDGLNAGERIVVDGIQKLHDNSVVVLLPAGKAVQGNKVQGT